MTTLANIKPLAFKLVQTREQAFPEVSPGVKPVGSRILVQLRNSALKTEAGIELVQNTTETEFDNTQTALLLAVGPCAFRNRETLEQWPEGDWAKPGSFIRVPKYGKEMWRRPGKNGCNATFAMFDDLQIIGVLTIDPLEDKAFL